MDAPDSLLAPGTVLASLDGLRPDSATIVERVDGTRRVSVLILRDVLGVRAFLNLCPHARWPLENFDGRVLFSDDGHLMCAAHGAVFDPLTGACRGGPGLGHGLMVIPVDVHDDGMVVINGPMHRAA